MLILCTQRIEISHIRLSAHFSATLPAPLLKGLLNAVGKHESCKQSTEAAHGERQQNTINMLTRLPGVSGTRGPHSQEAGVDAQGMAQALQSP